MVNAYSIALTKNYFQGSFSYSICQWTNLEYFVIQDNQFTGSLPSCLGQWKLFKFFYLYLNKFTGVLEPCWCELQPLQNLDVSNNKFHGTFPSCIFNNLTQLLAVGFTDNDFTGLLFFPINEIMPYVSTFSVATNKLNGTLPESVRSMNEIETFSLFINAFTGTFPDCWTTRQTALKQLGILENNFVGT